MSEFPGVETQHHGLRDFGQEIVHELDTVLHHDRALAEEFRKGLPKDVHNVQVRQQRPDRVNMRTIVLGAGPFEITDLARFNTRDSVVITVQSNNTIAIASSDTVALSHLTTGGPSVAIPTGAARSFSYTGPIWVVGPQGTVIDVVIEYFSNE